MHYLALEDRRAFAHECQYHLKIVIRARCWATSSSIEGFGHHVELMHLRVARTISNCILQILQRFF
jgi:hypothetical protein